MKEKEYKILIVDDSPISRKAILTELKPLNAEFFESPDGRHAIISALKIKPDLITLDVEMPKMNGFDVCRQLRNNKMTREIPIIMVTSRATKAELEKGFQAGVAEYFVKPFPKGELYKHIVRVLTGITGEKIGKAIIASSDNNSRHIIRLALEKTGFSISRFHNASELLGSFNSDTDILILDQNIEGINALELTNILRSKKELEHIPIIYVTDTDDPFHLVQALDLGANDYIQKPFWDRELLARINSLIKSKRLYDEVQNQKNIMESLAMTDKLTGLFNRHFLEEVMEKEFAKSIRNKHSLCLAIMDVDHFKKFNDTYGHQNGDVVLQELGTLLKSSFRVGDIVARYGGEEFIVVLPETSAKKATEKMDHFRKVVEEFSVASTCGEHQMQFTISVGVASTKDGIKNQDDLLKFADECLYKSKEMGRNRVTLYQNE